MATARVTYIVYGSSDHWLEDWVPMIVDSLMEDGLVRIYRFELRDGIVLDADCSRKKGEVRRGKK